MDPLAKVIEARWNETSAILANNGLVNKDYMRNL
jgi:hypothetical protein